MGGDKELVEVNIESKKERCRSKYGRSNLLRQEMCYRAHIKMLEEKWKTKFNIKSKLWTIDVKRLL